MFGLRIVPSVVSGSPNNSLILQILRRSLALDSDAPLAHDLDGLAGSWSKQEAEEFAAAVKGFEELDPSLWQDAPDAP